MAKKKEPKINKKVSKDVMKLNDLFVDSTDKVNMAAFIKSNKRSKEVDSINKKIDALIKGETADIKSHTGEDISTFLIKTLNDNDREKRHNVKTIEDVFSTEDATVAQFFHERYKNRNLLYEDLKVITEQLFQMDEAISTTRDAIVTSDDMSQLISRMITFENVTDDKIRDNYISIVEGMEDKLKLHIKIKDHIVPKTLTYGNYYTYTIPYSKLFENYYKMKTKKDSINGKTLESVNESFSKDFRSKHSLTSDSKIIQNKFNEHLDAIKVITESPGLPIVEGLDVDSLMGDDVFKKSVKKYAPMTQTSSMVNDGVKDMQEGMFDNVDGCYVQMLDPRKIVPIRIMNSTLGYYYIHEVQATVKTSFTTSISYTSNKTKPDQLEDDFIGTITDQIVKAFDKRYLDNNLKFKELISNSLRYNNLYKKELKFEFIPVEYITEHVINEDENGNGVSVLYRSLFYAKLYLAILIFKLMTVITRSTDTRIYYVKQSGFDQDLTNSLQTVARGIKEKQINFMDLLSYQSMVSKVGHMKDIFMPINMWAS